jgi:hypothetical protein
MGCNNKLYYTSILGLTVLQKLTFKHRFGLVPFSVARLHQLVQKVRGKVFLHAGNSTALQ